MCRSAAGFQSVVVAAVDDARQLPVIARQQPLEAAAELGGLDFAGVGRADGRSRRRRIRCRPSESSGRGIRAAAGLIERCRQAGEVHHVAPKRPLIRDVVDREDRTHPLVAGMRAVQLHEEDRHEARLPVVGVDHVDRKSEVRDQFQNGAAEEDDTARRCPSSPAVRRSRSVPDRVRGPAWGRRVRKYDACSMRKTGTSEPGRCERKTRQASRRSPIGTGSTIPVGSMGTPARRQRVVERHHDGREVASLRQARGKAPTTSARPPVLANPTTSLAARSTRTATR